MNPIHWDESHQAPWNSRHSANAADPVQHMESHCSHTHGALTQCSGQPKVNQYYLKTEENKRVEHIHHFFIPVSEVTIFKKYHSNVCSDLLLLMTSKRLKISIFLQCLTLPPEMTKSLFLLSIMSCSLFNQAELLIHPLEEWNTLIIHWKCTEL